ncbi:FecR domain-containing protein [Chitinophaga sp. 212800010-3]|uniref:FecR family protein n=1 Tax=unclassified Chitinophaga TaxID=2619133 RepID=UPI002DE9F7C7|nr:FecR family protein [Chitinophaga sp. 212800010-3]
MTREEITILTEKVVSGTATDAELIQYNQLFNAFMQQNTWDETVFGDKASIEATIRQRLQPMLERGKVRPMRVWYKRTAAAAALVLLMSIGYFFYKHSTTEKLLPQSERFRNDIKAPTGNHAMLTLSNGRQILLDSAGSGTLAVQGQVSVSKGANGQIVYHGVGSTSSLNTIQLPAGSQPLSIVLADGTKVWLDAGSSLTYPTTFNGNNRTVTVAGQAYFEVAANSNQPFSVKAGNSSVDVLGTAFNLRIFQDEGKLKVTLVGGAVKVNTPAASQLLRPGEQAILEHNGKLQIDTNADLEEALAWKEGMFYFDGADISTIMSELQRYYNVEVIYQADVKDLFIAKIPRDVPVSQLLSLLEMTNLVHFKIDGRRITVIK